MNDNISIIHKSGKNAAAIVQDLLTLARRGVSEVKIINLEEIVSDYLNSLWKAGLSIHQCL